MNKTWWKVCSTSFLTILEGSYKHSMGTYNSQLLLKLEILTIFVQEEGCLAFQAKNMNNIDNVEAKLMLKCEINQISFQASKGDDSFPLNF
jgi:hypothetical protein